jgi:hypothetical protein
MTVLLGVQEDSMIKIKMFHRHRPSDADALVRRWNDLEAVVGRTVYVVGPLYKQVISYVRNTRCVIGHK